jgi:hypothetical protein
MTERLKTYSPNSVSVIITHDATGIVHTVTGFSEDSIVAIERNSETFTMYRGADDTKTRIYNSDSSATITIPLQQTSNSNDIFSLLYEFDRARLNSDGLFSLQIKDLTGRSVYYSDEAYIAIIPNSSFSNSMELREWLLHAASLNTAIGGNSRFSTDDANSVAALGGTVQSQWTP